jgi:hypothetical protein
MLHVLSTNQIKFMTRTSTATNILGLSALASAEKKRWIDDAGVAGSPFHTRTEWSR